MPQITMGDDMARLVKTLLRDEAGFTAIEYGLISAVSIALAGQVFSRF